MNRMIRIASFSLIAALTAFGCNKTNQSTTVTASDAKPLIAKQAIYASYGEPVEPHGAATAASALLANLPAYEGKPVRVTGTVSKTCERKGCWLEMTDGGKSLFVKFTCPIDGRLIPMEALGKPAVVEGELVIKEISEADARHLAEEGGKSPDDVAKIVGPQKQVTLKSPGAVVFGISK